MDPRPSFARKFNLAHLNNAMRDPTDTKYRRSLSNSRCSSERMVPPCDIGGCQDLLISPCCSPVPGGDDISSYSSSSAISFLKKKFKVISLFSTSFDLKASVLVVWVRKQTSDPHHKTARQRLAFLFCSCSSVRENKQVSIGHQSIVFRLFLTVVKILSIPCI